MMLFSYFFFTLCIGTSLLTDEERSLPRSSSSDDDHSIVSSTACLRFEADAAGQEENAKAEQLIRCLLNEQGLLDVPDDEIQSLVEKEGIENLNFILAKLQPHPKERVYTSLTWEQSKDIIEKMTHLAEPDILGMKFVMSYLVESQRKINYARLNGNSVAKVIRKRIAKIGLYFGIAALCGVVEHFSKETELVHDAVALMNTYPKTLFVSSLGLMAGRMVLSGIIATPFSSMFTAVIGIIWEHPANKLCVLFVGNAITSIIPFIHYNTCPQCYVDTVIRLISRNPATSFVWSVMFSDKYFTQAKFFEIVKGHILPMSGTVSYWVQVLISNSFLDLQVSGLPGITEDSAIALVLGKFSMKTFTVVFSTFAALSWARMLVLHSGEHVDKIKLFFKAIILTLLVISTVLPDGPIQEIYDGFTPSMSGMKLMALIAFASFLSNVGTYAITEDGSWKEVANQWEMLQQLREEEKRISPVFIE